MPKNEAILIAGWLSRTSAAAAQLSAGRPVCALIEAAAC